MSVAPGFENLQRQDALSVDFMKRFLPVSFYVLRQLLSNVETNTSSFNHQHDFMTFPAL